MPKSPSKFRPDHWFAAAAKGDVVQLERWHRSGVLKNRLDPARVDAAPGPGRPTFFRLIDKKGDNALMVALRACRADYAVRLLELGPQPGALRGGKPGAFGLVSRLKDPKLPLDRLVALLVEQGHDVNERVDDSNALRLAAGDGNVRMVGLLLAAGAHVRPAQCEPPLYDAISGGSPEVVECLLAAGANPNQPSPRLTFSPLMLLVSAWRMDPSDSQFESSRRKILRQLLLAGADPDASHTEHTGEVMRVVDYLPENNPAAQAAFKFDCAWARAQRMSESLPKSSPDSLPRPRM